MAIDPETIGIGAAGGTGGIIAAVIHLFNREKLNDLKKDLEEHKRVSVTVANCVPCQKRSDDTTRDLRAEIAIIREDFKTDMTEIKRDIKELLMHSLQRRSGDA